MDSGVKEQVGYTYTPAPFFVDCRQYWQICQHLKPGGGGIEWFSRKHGWLPARIENVRFYSRFKTEANARKALAKHEGA